MGAANSCKGDGLTPLFADQVIAKGSKGLREDAGEGLGRMWTHGPLLKNLPFDREVPFAGVCSDLDVHGFPSSH